MIARRVLQGCLWDPWKAEDGKGIYKIVYRAIVRH